MIYLASPYSHPDPDIKLVRFRCACLAASTYMRQGYYIFSPIAHGHPIAVTGGLPHDFAFWRSHSLAMIKACDELWVLMLLGWQDSIGVRAEISTASRLGRPVLFKECQP